MTQKAKLYFVHATSPLHAGVGAGLDAISLPTARERWTGYPFLPGSSVKGVLREAAERLQAEGKIASKDIFGAFGPSTEHAGDARGGLVLSDASLLALPVRSLFGTFAWVTCPYAVTRLLRDVRESEESNKGRPVEILDKIATKDDDTSWVATGSVLRAPNEQLYLEELLIKGTQEKSDVNPLAEWIAEALWPNDAKAKTFFLRRLVVLTDDVFGFFTRTATEIRHRVKIDATTGTAAKSGPWTEEHLPAETLLHGLVIGRPTQYFDRYTEKAASEGHKGIEIKADDSLKTIQTILSAGGSLRFGGKSTAGMGRARLRMVS